MQDGFSTLCAFTHNAAHFVRLGFSIVPHPWLPEKIATDCVGCPKFRQCTQYAMALPLRGRSLRTSPAGQRPYLAMPDTSRRSCRTRAAPSAHDGAHGAVDGAVASRDPLMEPSTLSSSISVGARRRHRAGGLPHRRRPLRHQGARRRSICAARRRRRRPAPPARSRSTSPPRRRCSCRSAHLAATGGRARAIVVNSGCANACTGDAGHKVAELMTAETARALGCEAEEVLVASTGVIGVSLDPRTVTSGIIAAHDALEPRRRTPTRRAPS